MMDFSQLEQHPFLSSGLILMAIGGMLYYLKQLPWLVYNVIERFCLVRIEILNSDEAYQWMQLWLADRLSHTLSVSVLTKRGHNPDLDCEDARSTQDNRPIIHFVPAVGTYFFWYKSRLVTLNRNRQHDGGGRGTVSEGAGYQSILRDKESFTIRIFSRNKNLARQILQECRDRALPEDGKIDILIPAHGYWSLGTRVRPRALDSVILDGRQSADLLADVREFLNSPEWYCKIGVPYRRGYLLHGPPGNGKTSVVKALAGELDMSIYLLMLSDPTINDNGLNDLLAKVPARSIVLLEDIDCAFVKRQRAEEKTGLLTFSGLLNALDGVASPEGRIVMMTTNHLDKLDPALVRPGRADVKIYFGNATADQTARLFERFFPTNACLAGEFAHLVGERRYSMAALQDYLMIHRSDPEAALRNAAEISRDAVDQCGRGEEKEGRSPHLHSALAVKKRRSAVS